jgi:polyhydroxyalkanoate synthesis regulator phasin
VPISRLQQAGGLNFGRAAEITRDELKFTKFVGRLRKKFSTIFDDLLKTQLVLKGVLTEQDWKSFYQDIEYEFAQDAYYTESKEQEILRSRAELLTQMSQFVGQFYSRAYIQKHVLRLTNSEIEELEKEMQAEAPPIEDTPPDSGESAKPKKAPASTNK